MSAIVLNIKKNVPSILINLVKEVSLLVLLGHFIIVSICTGPSYIDPKIVYVYPFPFGKDLTYFIT